MSYIIPMISMALLVGGTLPMIASAQPGRSEVTEGNRLYNESRFDEAHEQYLAALRAAPDSSIAPFNDGNALYRTGEFQRAIEAFQEAAERDDPAIDGHAWYNLGNALYRQQQLEPALEAYKQALRENPTDADAKHNLELTLEQLEQQSDDQDQQDQQDQQEQRESESPPPSSGELSREEAERLLQAINEDPSQIQRKRRNPTPARRPRRPW